MKADRSTESNITGIILGGIIRSFDVATFITSNGTVAPVKLFTSGAESLLAKIK